MTKLIKPIILICAFSLLFSCSENSSYEKVKIFISWPGGEGLPHYQWKKGETKPTGIEPAFIEQLLKVAELEYEYITDLVLQERGDPRIYSLTTGQADICIRAITINEERKKHVLFTDSYYSDGLSALIRKNDSIYSLSDLIGKRIYTLEFTTAYNWAKKNLSESKLITYERFDTVFIKPESLLLDNKIDAYILDKSFLNEIAKKELKLEVIKRKFTHEEIGIAVSKNRPDLVSKLNKAIKELKKSGDLDKLLYEFN
jgi:ABC-type amino acid transport substrate-binding protein